jgi:transposase-like protein
MIEEIKFKYHYKWQQVDFRDAEFSITDLYCPECGKHDVWQEGGEGDYYVGSEYICVDCKSTFTTQSGSSNPDDPKIVKFMEELSRARNPDVI